MIVGLISAARRPPDIETSGDNVGQCWRVSAMNQEVSAGMGRRNMQKVCRRMFFERGIGFEAEMISLLYTRHEKPCEGSGVFAVWSY